MLIRSRDVIVLGGTGFLGRRVVRCLQRQGWGVLDGPRTRRKVYELGGPDVFAYRDILRRLAARSGRHRLLLPVPFWMWRRRRLR